MKARKAYLLEAGCGTGGNLRCLAANGYRVIGLEPNRQMAAIARRTAGCKVYQGDLATGLSQVREKVHAVLLLDVLEHIEDDSAALRAVNAYLPPNGWLVVTAPAYPFLWSYHDESFGHYRRYTMGSLRDKLTASGFSVVWASYFNSLLFPLAACVRILRKALGDGARRTDFRQLPLPVNAVLTKLLACEAHLVGRIPTPFGLSLQAVARKK